MEKIALTEFFSSSDIKSLKLSSYADEPLNLLAKIPEIIINFFKNLKGLSTQQQLAQLKVESTGIFCCDSLITKKPYVNDDLKIYIGQGTKIEAGSMIKANNIIMPKAEIRHCAYIRENCLIGNNSVIGHCSEVKNSILFYHVEAGHFNYIGDSLIGSYVNLGAGAKLANLEFRSLQNKQKGLFSAIMLKNSKKQLFKGPAKFGSVIGEGSEIGCNAVLAPGCFVTKNTKILPNLFLKKGFYRQKILM